LAVGVAVAVTAFEPLAATLEGLSVGMSVTAASDGLTAEGVGAAMMALKFITGTVVAACRGRITALARAASVGKMMRVLCIFM